MQFKLFSAARYSFEILNLPIDLLESESLRIKSQNPDSFTGKQKIEMIRLEIKRQTEILSQKSREENLQEFGKMLGIDN